MWYVCMGWCIIEYVRHEYRGICLFVCSCECREHKYKTLLYGGNMELSTQGPNGLAKME